MSKCKNCMELKVSEAAIEAVKKHEKESGAVMSCLHEIQDKCGYISLDNQKYLSKKLNVPLSDIYGIITFYNRFSLKPKGKYNIQVCLGTACYVKGSSALLEALENKLGIKEGDTTKDGIFSIEAVRCLGACGLAPVVVINEEVYGKVTVDMLDEILNKYKNNKG